MSTGTVSIDYEIETHSQRVHSVRFGSKVITMLGGTRRGVQWQVEEAIKNIDIASALAKSLCEQVDAA